MRAYSWMRRPPRCKTCCLCGAILIFRNRRGSFRTYPALRGMPFPAEFDVKQGTKRTLDHRSEGVVASHKSADLLGPLHLPAKRPSEREGKPLPVLAKMDFPEGLDALCERYHYLWWYDGGCLYFRSRTWFIENLYEIPPRTLALLQKQLKEHGELDIQGMDALSRSDHLAGWKGHCGSCRSRARGVCAQPYQQHAVPTLAYWRDTVRDNGKFWVPANLLDVERRAKKPGAKRIWPATERNDRSATAGAIHAGHHKAWLGDHRSQLSTRLSDHAAGTRQPRIRGAAAIAW